MKKLLILLGIIAALPLNAQDYLITFGGTGAAASVTAVKVENLTAGTALLLNGSDILHLTSITTGVNKIAEEEKSKLMISPNPMSDFSKLEVSPSEAGEATISVNDMSGKIVASIRSYLGKASQEFRVSGLKRGIYFINVKGQHYAYSAKLLSNGEPKESARIEKLSYVNSAEEKEIKLVSRGLQSVVDMDYSEGDRLKFTGISGNYSTVMMDIPTSGKSLNFNFTACKDGDNNNYPVVTIGTQTWMAENLKATRFNDNSNIPLVSDGDSWGALSTPAYCWYDNDEASYKNLYGALYNWYTINTGKLCPDGWHVSTDGEWTTLTRYLLNNGYGFVDNGVTYIAKALAASWGWAIHTGHGASVGDILSSNNASGLTLLPGGWRNEGGGNFLATLSEGLWWTSTPHQLSNGHASWNRDILSNSGFVVRGLVGGGRANQQGFSVRCIEGEPGLPMITTDVVSSIASASALCGGNVITENGASVITSGICWSTSPNPTITDSKLSGEVSLGAFTINITGLSEGTTYYVRAFAKNSVGTAYGNQVSFNTKLTDVEGNTYNTVTIGNQIWMAENLKTTKYRNGDIIGTTSPATKNISGESSPKYQWAFGGNESNADTYGRLYTWYAVTDSRNICPTGWHVPGDASWTTLTSWLEGETAAGGAMKEAGTTHWSSPNTGATNISGFTALPGGDRSITGTFGYQGTDATWWTSTEFNTNNAKYLCLRYDVSGVNRADFDKPNGFSVRCLKGENSLPALTTKAISAITQTNGVSGGLVNSEGGSVVTSRGVCWSTSANPTITGNKIMSGSGTGNFTCSISGLTAGTLYHVKAFATNSSGTSYGNELLLKTYSGTINDVDGNSYKTVQIGTQLWMAENLKTTKYNDGSSIQVVSDDLTWRSLGTPAYSWYNNDPAANKIVYGALYNWHTVNTGKLCPAGWHVPTRAEFATLLSFLGGEVGNKLKEAGQAHWWTDSGATNESGFTALPAGIRSSDGVFSNMYYIGRWWLSEDIETIAYCRDTQASVSWVGQGSSDKVSGYSVRCLKDN